MSKAVRWEQCEVDEYLKRFDRDRTADKVTHLERATSHESVGKKKDKGFSKRYRVHCHTRGRRLGDCDGRAIKYPLDGITKGALWPDDGYKFVTQVSFTQEIGEEDQTIIEIIEVSK